MPRVVPSLEPLKGLTKLSELYLAGLIGITSLEPLKGMGKLDKIIIYDTGITSLAPRKG